LYAHLSMTDAGKCYLDKRSRKRPLQIRLEWKILTASTLGQQNQPSPRVKPSSVVYWMRFLLAICAGLANELLHIDVMTFGDYAVIVGIGLGVLFYLASIMMVLHVFHYGEAELRGKNRHITLGGGTFIFVWIMVSVLFYTLKI